MQCLNAFRLKNLIAKLNSYWGLYMRGHTKLSNCLAIHNNALTLDSLWLQAFLPNQCLLLAETKWHDCSQTLVTVWPDLRTGSLYTPTTNIHKHSTECSLAQTACHKSTFIQPIVTDNFFQLFQTAHYNCWPSYSCWSHPLCKLPDPDFGYTLPDNWCVWAFGCFHDYTLSDY